MFDETYTYYTFDLLRVSGNKGRVHVYKGRTRICKTYMWEEIGWGYTSISGLVLGQLFWGSDYCKTSLCVTLPVSSSLLNLNLHVHLLVPSSHLPLTLCVLLFLSLIFFPPSFPPLLFFLSSPPPLLILHVVLHLSSFLPPSCLIPSPPSYPSYPSPCLRTGRES